MFIDPNPDPSSVYAAAVELAREGRYEEALQKHLWYHEHALQFDPSQSGVRLSFALSEWVQLGELYPPARAALVVIRDTKARILRNGQGSVALFSDVASINFYLEEQSETADLFLLLHHSQQNLARHCYREAEEGLVAKGEYCICSHYVPDSQTRFAAIRELRRLLRENSKSFADASLQEKTQQAAEERFEAEVVRLIHLLRGANRNEEADRIRELAEVECGHEIICSKPFNNSVGCTCGRRSKESPPAD
jgi:hypothetical protein